MSIIEDHKEILAEQNAETFHIQQEAQRLLLALLKNSHRYQLKPAKPESFRDVSKLSGVLEYHLLKTNGRPPTILVGLPSTFSEITIRQLEDNALVVETPDEIGQRHIIAQKQGIKYDFTYPNPIELANQPNDIALKAPNGSDVTFDEQPPALSLACIGIRIHDALSNQEIGSLNIAAT